MKNLVHYSVCPVCTSAEIIIALTAKDFTVSGKNFQVMECRNCSLRFTQDVPDAQSIAPYYKAEEYISHTDTSKGLINRVYKIVRQKTLISKRRLIEKYTGLKKGDLLDVGSGTGSFVNEMKQNGWQVEGLEPDEDARKLAARQYGIQLSDTGRLYQLKAGIFDAITLWHVLEHVHDLDGYVQQLKNILRQTGKLFIAVPNYTSQDARSYGQYWAAYDVPRHLYHFSPASMQLLMEKNGLKILQFKPMWYDSFYVSLLSSKYKNGKTNWPGAAWTALRSNLEALGDVKKCSSVIYIIEKTV
jgi:2-polyprenyl-3-methyl-5-hydroxy-6-metoxy-1,4-benzoquinol methylase